MSTIVKGCTVLVEHLLERTTIKFGGIEQTSVIRYRECVNKLHHQCWRLANPFGILQVVKR